MGSWKPVRSRIPLLRTDEDRNDQLRLALVAFMQEGQWLQAEVRELTNETYLIDSVNLRYNDWCGRVISRLDRERPGWSALFLARPIQTQYMGQYARRDKVWNDLAQRVEALRSLMNKLD
jgi:hypothetical protein